MEYWQTQVHVLGQALARSDAVAKGRGHELHLPAPCPTLPWPLTLRGGSMAPFGHGLVRRCGLVNRMGYQR